MSSFHRAGGKMRSVELVTALGINRDSLRSTLLSLKNMGLIQKNPGYGHPLRPEYLLTSYGEKTAAACDEYLLKIEGAECLLRKWSAPLLMALNKGTDRFNDLCKTISITPRALTQILRSLESERLLVRTIEIGYPPTTTYRLTSRGRIVSEQVERVNQCLLENR